MNSITIIGHFNFKGSISDGQTVKTNIIANALENTGNNFKITRIDTANWKRKNIILLVKIIYAFLTCKHIIFLPAHRGIKVFLSLFTILNFIFRRRLHYIVTGAWLANMIETKPKMIKKIKKIDNIYVQTETLKKSLEKLGISNNLILLPNFKKFSIKKSLKNIKYQDGEGTIRLCILSRVTPNKGISDAIDVINRLNDELPEQRYLLDIYGPIDKNYKMEFEELIGENRYVSYKGILEQGKIQSEMSQYFLLLFPTKYYTEGLPGTIIDAYSSGLPVLASRWESSEEFVIEGVTGFIFDFNNKEDFYRKLRYLVKNPRKVDDLRVNCFKESINYHEENVISILLNKIIL